MTAALPTALPQIEIDALHATAKKVRDAEKSYRAKAYQLAAEIYDFGKKHDKAAIMAWLQEKGLKVTEKSNSWTAAAKLALAYQDGDKWHVDDGQVGKYAQALEYLELQSVADARVWFEKNSIASTLRFARNAIPSASGGSNGGTSSGSGGQDSSNGASGTVIAEAVKKIETAWETAAKTARVDDGGVVISIDREKAGVAPDAQFVELIAKIDAENRLTILGLARKDAIEIEADIQAAVPEPEEPAGTPSTSSRSSIDIFKQLADVPSAIGGDGHFALIVNDSNAQAYVTFDMGDGLIVRHSLGQSIDLLPTGVWLLKYDILKALRYAVTYLRDEHWSIGKAADGSHAIIIKPRDNKTTDEWKDAQKSKPAQKLPGGILQGKFEFIISIEEVTSSSTIKFAAARVEAKQGRTLFHFASDALKALCGFLGEGKKEDGAAIMSIDGKDLKVRLVTRTDADSMKFTLDRREGDAHARVFVHRDDLTGLRKVIGSGNMRIAVSDHGLYVTQNGEDDVCEVFVPTSSGHRRDGNAYEWVEMKSLIPVPDVEASGSAGDAQAEGGERSDAGQAEAA